MQKRADEIGAKLCLQSVPLQGTFISLQCSKMPKSPDGVLLLKDFLHNI